jgi:glucose-6-phosphate isomerase
MSKNTLSFSSLFCFEQAIGSNGLSENDFNNVLEKGKIYQQKWQKKIDFPLFKAIHQRDYLKNLKDQADKLRIFDDILVLGTGGSSLGGQTLQALAKDDTPKLHFLDNIDPLTFESVFNRDWSKTGLIVISKSGETSETLLQFLVALKKMRAEINDLDISHHLLVITEPKQSSLTKLADYFNCPILPHDQGIGGRYAVLSNVGLLPAYLMDLHIEDLLHGAQSTLDSFQTSSPKASEPLLGAALHAGFMKKGILETVMMPYFDQGERLSAWHAQLWAESLGKDGKGLTPLRALGAVDQHSQLQLYLDGPKNKFFTLLCVHQEEKGEQPNTDLGFTENLQLLSKHCLGNLMEAEQKATYETLAKNGCPTRLINFSTYNERILGSLFVHFMLETILMAEYLDVNAFDQPAVEQGKILAQTYLNSQQISNQAKAA